MRHVDDDGQSQRLAVLGRRFAHRRHEELHGREDEAAVGRHQQGLGAAAAAPAAATADALDLNLGLRRGVEQQRQVDGRAQYDAQFQTPQRAHQKGHQPRQ